MEPEYNNLAERFDMLEEPMKSYFYNLLNTCVDLQLEVRKENDNSAQTKSSIIY